MNLCQICGYEMQGNHCQQCFAAFNPPLSLRLLTTVQAMMFMVPESYKAVSAANGTTGKTVRLRTWQRLERAEEYLIARYNRPPAEESIPTLWGNVDYAEYGGEA